MVKFVRLTLPVGAPIEVNPDHIMSMARSADDPDMTLLRLTGSVGSKEAIRGKETPDEIKQKVANAYLI